MGDSKQPITVYCDGGCRGNGKQDSVGGYGIVIEYRGQTTELMGYEFRTSNNRMELTAVIEALKYLSDDYRTPIQIITDSNYVVMGTSKWRFSWESNNWRTKTGDVKNKDLWLELFSLADRFDIIGVEHCYGHATTKGNIRADYLANIAMDNAMLVM